jgi:hypothetical protein
MVLPSGAPENAVLSSASSERRVTTIALACPPILCVAITSLWKRSTNDLGLQADCMPEKQTNDYVGDSTTTVIAALEVRLAR